jgi:hypothetical protein
LLIFYALCLAQVFTAAFVLKEGGRAERIGVLWQLLNAAIQMVNELSGVHSTVVQLIADGVFAIGMLPAAIYFVSYWIGVQTLLSALQFGLEAAYLVTDRPIDFLFAYLSNINFCLMLINLNVATVASMWARRPKAKKAASAASTSIQIPLNAPQH